MRKALTQTVVFLILFVLAVPAWAYYVGTTNVGSLDTIADYAALANSGYQSELAFIQSSDPNAIGYQLVPFSFQQVYLDIGNTTKAPNVYAALLPDDPAYYIIKFGNLKISPVNYDTYLFRNSAALNYAVINLSSLGGDINNINIGKVSHVGVVPEPSTLVLLGGGLLGLVVYGRRRTKQ